MTVIGFNFNKISIERLGSKQGKLTISNNVSLQNVSEAKIPFGDDKSKCVKIDFKFESKYEPKVADIILEGDFIYMLPKETADKVLASWKDKKAIDKELLSPMMNAILNKANVEALILSKELNLPSPIPLPKVNVQTPADKK